MRVICIHEPLEDLYTTVYTTVADGLCKKVIIDEFKAAIRPQVANHLENDDNLWNSLYIEEEIDFSDPNILDETVSIRIRVSERMRYVQQIDH